MTLTYQLEREDTDVLSIVKEKTAELAQTHRTAWQTLRDAKVSAVQEQIPEEHLTVRQEPNGATPTKEKPAADVLPQPEPEMAPTKETPTDSTTGSLPLNTPATPAQETPLPDHSAVLVEGIRPRQRAALLLLLQEAQWNTERRHLYLRERFNCERIEDLSSEQADQWLLALQRAEREANQNTMQQRQIQRRSGNVHRNGTPQAESA